MKGFLTEKIQSEQKKGEKIKAVAQQGVGFDGQKLVLTPDLIKSTLSVSYFCEAVHNAK